MDTHAARKARREAFKRDLAASYTDTEAVPPEWLDLTRAIIDGAGKLRERITAETEAFVTEPDVKRALARRDEARSEVLRTIAVLNQMIARLNLIAPHQRFTKTPIDADEALRPLFRTPRPSAGATSG